MPGTGFWPPSQTSSVLAEVLLQPWEQVARSVGGRRAQLFPSLNWALLEGRAVQGERWRGASPSPWSLVWVLPEALRGNGAGLRGTEHAWRPQPGPLHPWNGQETAPAGIAGHPAPINAFWFYCSYSFWLDLVHVRNAETDRGATTDTAINYEISGYEQNWMSMFFQTFRAARRGDPDVQGDDSPGFHVHVQGHQGQVIITWRGDGQTHLSMHLGSKDASVPVTIDASCGDCGSWWRKCRASLWPW
ncbi:uncharacterized protein LOC128854425 [Cuculus canorus]|uniref:uncharacterized protein LOC128854425 n=1 Tax=Cuculus canorus TaxID=55661 RepID=UPI0023AAD002|nr:uncharacterized protein LOC128854425 [Cuculus canorus]